MKYYRVSTSQNSVKELLQNLVPQKAAQFVDLNENLPHFSKPFSKDIQKLAEIQQKVEYLRQQMINNRIQVKQPEISQNLQSTTSIEQYLDQLIEEHKTLSQELQAHHQTRQAIASKLTIL